MVNFYKRNTKLINFNIIISVIFLLATFFWLFTNIFSGVIDVSNDLSQKMLTVSTVLFGFVFTSFSILLSLIGNEGLVERDKAGYLDQYCNWCFATFIWLVLAVSIGFINSFSVIPNKNHFLYLFQIIFGLGGYFNFIYCLFNTWKLISKVRKDRKNDLNKKSKNSN